VSDFRDDIIFSEKMAFFDNWRVQLAMLKVLDDEVEKELANRESAYTNASQYLTFPAFGRTGTC
jgi:hypothetical protein